MVLVFDIGNSDITIGLYKDNAWQHTWRLQSQAELPEMFYAMKVRDYFLESRIGLDEVSRVAISSVVPDLTGKAGAYRADVV
jgi:type III pantothenate kinase